ncbi:rod shape-determining protein MreC [Rhodobacteraceae bacterium W635]|uniref:rod shape-determining protein MreC n=1 Tax=Nioella halotolerans TaxID=2303578 RepID=UPI000E3EB8EF|nr:rod shape-determining protein MreC [Rhodobacteraceae bacterium W635]
MARERADNSHTRPVRRLLVAVVVLCLLALVIVWRIDNPRVERLRSNITDQVVPNLEWAMAPVTALGRMVDDFQSYTRLYQQNEELRRELQQMRAWREAALQLEQENARLLDLNRVQLDPELTYVTGIVRADSGSPFRRSVLINVGARDGIVDGWATMDGLGVVGRISGVGENTSRVILLTDAAHRTPVSVMPSSQQAMLLGDNTALPVLEFLETPEDISPGDRIVTSGDGGVFPPGLLVGHVVVDRDGRLRARPSADMSRLNFLRVMRSHPGTSLADPGGLIGPPWPLPSDSATDAAPEDPDDTVELTPEDESADG